MRRVLSAFFGRMAHNEAQTMPGSPMFYVLNVLLFRPFLLHFLLKTHSKPGGRTDLPFSTPVSLLVVDYPGFLLFLLVLGLFAIGLGTGISPLSARFGRNSG